MMSWASLISVFLCQAVLQLLLLLAGDVEQNPGPPKILKQGGPTTWYGVQVRLTPPQCYQALFSFLRESLGTRLRRLCVSFSGVDGARS